MLKLEPGTRFIRSDGEITGPLEVYDGDFYKFRCPKFGLYYSERGKSSPIKDTKLLDLVAEYKEDLTKKTINFWEARQAALEGKTVRIVGEMGGTFVKEAFTNTEFDWNNEVLSMEWEIVEEPARRTFYIIPFSYGGTATWKDKRVAQKFMLGLGGDALSVIEVTIDKDGRFIEGKNVEGESE